MRANFYVSSDDKKEPDVPEAKEPCPRCKRVRLVRRADGTYAYRCCGQPAEPAPPVFP